MIVHARAQSSQFYWPTTVLLYLRKYSSVAQAVAQDWYTWLGNDISSYDMCMPRIQAWYVHARAHQFYEYWPTYYCICANIPPWHRLWRRTGAPGWVMIYRLMCMPPIQAWYVHARAHQFYWPTYYCICANIPPWHRLWHKCTWLGSTCIRSSDDA